MRFISFILVIGAFLSAGTVNIVRAEDTAHTIKTDPLKQTRSVKIINIIDPITLQTKDNEIIRLSGIEFPDYTAEAPGQYSLIARDILKDMLLGKTITLYQTSDPKQQINRMGQSLAHVKRKDDGLWAQGLLLELGLARMRTTPETRELSQEMRTLEDKARTQSQGLWSAPSYSIKTPEDILNHIGTVQIVEGRIKSASINNGRIYLNFGQNWRDDFTVTIAPEDKNIFYRAGIDPLSWNGKIVQVRGWIDSYNGPVINLTHPEAIALVSQE